MKNNDMTKEELLDLQKTKSDIMNYKGDSLSRGFALLGLAINCVYFIALYKCNHIYYYQYEMGISVLFNLIFMLVVFLAGENVKVYNRKFAYVLLAVGIIQFARIFYLPLKAYKVGIDVMSLRTFVLLISCLVLSGIVIIASSIVSIIKSKKLENYNKNKGE